MNRYFWIILVLGAVLLSSCTPLAVPPAETPTPTATEVPPTETAVPVTGTSTINMLPPAVNAAVDFLAQSLGITDKTTLTVKSYEAVDWADGCLELGGPAEACMMMIVPGYRVVIVDASTKLEYVLHTDESGSNIRQAPMVEPAATPVLTFERTGGIAGVCQRLTVDSKGRYTLVNCGNVDTLVGSGPLPPDNWEIVQEWRSQYSSFVWESPVQPGADMFVDKLSFVGDGVEEANPEVQELILKLLDEWWINLPRTAPDFTLSGVEGLVLIGPTCPGPQTDDPECADKPYPLLFTVTDSKNETILAEVQTGVDGMFRIALPPGEYNLNPILTGRFPVGYPTLVKVEAEKFTKVTIMLESGLR